MSVSRDFIDSYSPEALHPRRRPRPRARTCHLNDRRVWIDNVSFRFPAVLERILLEPAPLLGGLPNALPARHALARTAQIFNPVFVGILEWPMV